MVELSLRDGSRIDQAEELLAQTVAPLVNSSAEAAHWARGSRDSQIERAVEQGHTGSELARRVVASLNREALLLEN